MKHFTKNDFNRKMPMLVITAALFITFGGCRKGHDKQVNSYTWYVTSLGDGSVLKVSYY